MLRAHFADSILVVGVGEVSGLVGLSTPRALISQRYIHKNFLAISYAACSIAALPHQSLSTSGQVNDLGKAIAISLS